MNFVELGFTRVGKDWLLDNYIRVSVDMYKHDHYYTI